MTRLLLRKHDFRAIHRPLTQSTLSLRARQELKILSNEADLQNDCDWQARKSGKVSIRRLLPFTIIHNETSTDYRRARFNDGRHLNLNVPLVEEM